MLSRRGRSWALSAMSLSAVLAAGCSGMQATPLMPSYPAQVGGKHGVSSSEDSACRQQAYQAAEKAKQDNVGKEIAFTAIGTIAGAAIGSAMTPGRPKGPRGPGPGAGPGGGPRGPGGPGGPGPRGPRGPDLTGAGAVTGAATGAAMSQSTLQDTQQVYDITYNNCIQSYKNYR